MACGCWGSWFDDGGEKFIMVEHQSGKHNYAEYSSADIANREKFRVQLGNFDPELLHHHTQGTALRALFHACCYMDSRSTTIWMKKYAQRHHGI
jgi:hypothetical protein